MLPCGSTTHKENHLEYEQDTETLNYKTKKLLNVMSLLGVKTFISLEEKKNVKLGWSIPQASGSNFLTEVVLIWEKKEPLWTQRKWDRNL